MVRKTIISALSAGFWAAFLPWQAGALGLGGITVQSRLNQPLEAKIALYSAGRIPVEALSAKLASQEAFARAGVERRVLALNHLRFHPVRKSGEIVIEVTSQQPVRAPFLDFLVAVSWPQGHLLQEYTVLLDPVSFSESASPTGARSETGTVYGPTQAGDTLWLIAKRLRPTPAITIKQMMLALQRANPNAFLHRNINGLRVGKVLQVPSVEEVLALSPAEAARQVRQQNQAWAGLHGQGASHRKQASLPLTGGPEAQSGDGTKGETGLWVASERRPPGEKVLPEAAGSEDRTHGGRQLSLAMAALRSQIREKGTLRARLQAVAQARSQPVVRQVAALQQLLGEAVPAPPGATAVEASVLTSGKRVKGASIAGLGPLLQGEFTYSLGGKQPFLWGGSLSLLVLVVLRMRRRKVAKHSLPSVRASKIFMEEPGAMLEPAMVSAHLSTALEPPQEAGKKPPLRAGGASGALRSKRGFQRIPKRAVPMPPGRRLAERNRGSGKGQVPAVLW